MTRTQVVNLLYAIVCAVAALSAESGALPIPEEWKHYVAGAAAVAMWLKSHWNYVTNPDGTPAAEPYSPPAKADAPNGPQ